MVLRDHKRCRGEGWAPPLAAFLMLGLLAAAVLGGCQRHAAGSAAQAGGEAEQTAGTQSQAERTKEMEEKARQLNEKAVEIQNMQGTEQEKIDAVNKLEQERQELNKTGGDGSTPPPAPQ